ISFVRTLPMLSLATSAPSDRGKRPSRSAREGISSLGATESPPVRTRWHPIPNFGLAMARSTASSNAGPFAISVALVRIPSRWARTIPSLTPRVYPKSSALRINAFILLYEELRPARNVITPHGRDEPSTISRAEAIYAPHLRAAHE